MSFLSLGFPNGPMNLTENIALYMVHSLSNRLSTQHPIPEHGLSFETLKDCEMIVQQVYSAYKNPSESHAENLD